MKMIIFDYNNEQVEVELPDKPIKSINVIVLSGYETGNVIFEGGTEIQFDASCFRFQSYYDGLYVVTGENIQKWLNFKPTGKKVTASYERQDLFD